jgi:FMN-dependent NADH-azoreductase
MPIHLLHIDASARGARSHSRALTRRLVETWMRMHPDTQVTYRDLGRQPPPHVDEAWIAAAFTPERERTPEMHAALRASDALVDELLRADVLALGAPMYNFSIPSTLKAYIDQIVRVGRTFLFEPEDAARPYKPLVHGKKAFVVTARGDTGYGPGGANAGMNHLDPYLGTILGFIGITDLDFVHVDNDEFGGARLEQSLGAAHDRLATMLAAGAGVSRAHPGSRGVT